MAASKQANKPFMHTHVQCSLANVGLAQACPNYQYVAEL